MCSNECEPNSGLEPMVPFAVRSAVSIISIVLGPEHLPSSDQVGLLTYRKKYEGRWHKNKNAGQCNQGHHDAHCAQPTEQPELARKDEEATEDKLNSGAKRCIAGVQDKLVHAPFESTSGFGFIPAASWGAVAAPFCPRSVKVLQIFILNSQRRCSERGGHCKSARVALFILDGNTNSGAVLESSEWRHRIA